EVMFVDDKGRPLGDPIKIEDFNGVSPGSRDQHGIIKGDINQAWLDVVRKHICDTYKVPYDKAKSRPRQFNLIYIAREMVTTLADENIKANTYLDIVKEMGDKTVVADSRSRIEYLRQEGMKKAEGIPAGARDEIQFVLPGLAAQESKYVNDVVSSTGARGIMQFMSGTWARVDGGEIDDVLSFTDQVAAASKLFSGKYDYLQNDKDDNVRQEFKLIQREFFGGDAEAFEHYFLAPVLINSYNSGEGRLAKCIRLFVETYPTAASLKKAIGEYPKGFGYDAYLLMTKLCSTVVGKDEDGHSIRRIRGYGRDSSQYVVRAYTLAQLLEEEK
ncbi:MAG: lytic transglycosylase domain-containing protein, partial [Patescibacteria group bacterium]